MAHQATPIGKALLRESSLQRYSPQSQFQTGSSKKGTPMPTQGLLSLLPAEEAESAILQTSLVRLRVETLEKSEASKKTPTKSFG